MKEGSLQVAWLFWISLSLGRDRGRYFSKASSPWESVLAVDLTGIFFLYFIAEIKKVFEEYDVARGGDYISSLRTYVVKDSV